MRPTAKLVQSQQWDGSWQENVEDKFVKEQGGFTAGSSCTYCLDYTTVDIKREKFAFRLLL